MMQNTSKQIRKLVESALRVMTSTDLYSLANFNGAVDSLVASTEDKNKVQDIASEAFDAGTLYFEKSLIIHEEKTKEITAVSVVLYVIKNHVHLHKL